MALLDFISNYDPENQFEVLKTYHKQIEYTVKNVYKLESIKKDRIENVIITGLGGSAIAGDLALNFLKDDLKVPVAVNRNYNLPGYASEKTLLIVSSYSGNTEETVSVFNEALERGCQIVCLTSGGKVKEIADNNGFPVVMLKTGFQPRFALGVSFFTLLHVLQNLELIPDHTGIIKEIETLWLRRSEELSAENNTAIEYAKEIAGYIPVIYSVDSYNSAVGYRFKCQFNENSKMHAFHNVFPELNHNEIVGWETFYEKQMQVILINIIDSEYHPQIAKRIEITSELANKVEAPILNIESQQCSFKLRLMDLVYLTDWITYYAAIFRGFNPSEIDNIHHLKNELSK